MNSVLAKWNKAGEATAMKAMLACCAARRWAQAMVAGRPYSGPVALGVAADQVWSTMEEPDWLEAFAAHPRIGERTPTPASTAARWSKQEQSSTADAGDEVLTRLTAGNAAYEKRYGFTYIVCATGKSAREMLAILEQRLKNDRETELREAAGQQREITRIRLRKWLMGMSAITTHVLDSVLGKPAPGIGVRLEMFDEDSWLLLSESATDADGRCRNLAREASAGLYRLTFSTSEYFSQQGRSSIYPEISITFRCSGEADYHLPLLLSDNSYTTYRGS